MVDINSIVQKNFLEWQSKSSDLFSINKGISNHVETYLETIPHSKYPVNKSDIKDIRIEVKPSYSFEAPLLANTCIGTLNCYVDNTNIFTLNIYSSKSILKKNIFFYFEDFIKNYCVYLENMFK